MNALALSNFRTLLAVNDMSDLVAMNDLQDAGIISDLCVKADDIADEDAPKAMEFLRGKK